MGKRIVLSDDGTMDTVLRCTECGEEMRYTFEPHEPEEGGTPEDRQYEEFIEWAIEDAESEHECDEETN